MRKLSVIFFVASLPLMLLSPAFGADENKGAPNTQQVAEKMRPPRGPMTMDKNISFISGSISNIDATVPESVKVEVINDADGKSHIVELGVGANILKVIEVGELKAGDKARVVTRRVGDKEIALSVVTGKLKEVRMPKPPAPIMPAPMVNEDQTKK